MRLFLLTIMVSALLACNDQVNERPKVATRITANDSNHSLNKVDPDTSTHPSHYRDIYDRYLPVELKNYLTAHLPGWTLPAPSKWDSIWFQSYKNDSCLVDFISGDFNGDTRNDYAVLLADETDSIAAWVIQSDQHGFSSIKLESFGKFDPHIQVGLELITPGELNYIDPDKDNPKPIKLKNRAIQIVYFETVATTYYWSNGKYRSVTTGD